MVDWVRLELDVDGFDDAAEQHRALYDLNKTCSADIPDRGAFYAYDDYVTQRIKVPSYDPAGIVLATFHHPRNTSAIAMNRRLGFVDRPA